MWAFLAHGIPFRIEGKTMFSDCPALRSLSYLFTAVTDPYDRKAVFAAMELSGCGVTEDDIRSYADRAKEMSPASIFALLLDELKVFSRVGVENAEYVYFALELLREAETNGSAASGRDGAAFVRLRCKDT